MQTATVIPKKIGFFKSNLGPQEKLFCEKISRKRRGNQREPSEESVFSGRVSGSAIREGQTFQSGPLTKDSGLCHKEFWKAWKK